MRALRWSLVAVAALAAALAVALWPPAPLEVAPRGDFEIAGVTIVNPGVGRTPDQRIEIHSGVIASISDDVSAATESSSVHRYAGAFVLPGLIDMHVHHPPAFDAGDVRLFELLYLDHGVTAVRDAGSFDGSILELRAQVAGGERAGPRIFACGPLIDGDPPTWPVPGFRVARDAGEAERAVDEIAATGVDCIKAYQNLTPDALRGLRAGASRHRLPLVGHVPFAVPLEDAHLDDVQHLSGVPSFAWERARSGKEGLRELEREWEGIDDEWIEQVVQISTEQHLVHTPTLVVIDRITRLGEYAELEAGPGAQLLPRWYREVLWRPGGPFGTEAFLTPPPAHPAAIRASTHRLVRALHEAGVTLHVGTDAFNPFVVPGVSMHEELASFVECGFTPEQALAAATWQNGESLPVAGLGTLRPGAPADLLVLREDPTRDLAALASIEAVIVDGRFYSRTSLDAAVERYRKKFGSFAADRVGMALAHLLARTSD